MLQKLLFKDKTFIIYVLSSNDNAYLQTTLFFLRHLTLIVFLLFIVDGGGGRAHPKIIVTLSDFHG